MTISYQRGTVPVFDLPARLLLARVRAGMNQTELARALGISRSTVSLYERAGADEGVAATVNVRRGTVMAWAMATGVDAVWLMTGQAADPDGGGDGPVLVRPKGFEPLTF